MNILVITTSEIKISVLVAAMKLWKRCGPFIPRLICKRPPAAMARRSLPPPVHAASALEIIRRLQGMEDLTIDEIALDQSQSLVTIFDVPDRPGVAASTFDGLAKAGVFVDMIVQSFGRDGQANLSFTVPQAAYSQTVELAQKIAKQIGCGGVNSSAKVAKLSVSGIGMRSHSGVAIRMFESLAAAGINVDMMSTSEVRVNVIVDGRQAEAALACVQAAFAEVRG